MIEKYIFYVLFVPTTIIWTVQTRFYKRQLLVCKKSSPGLDEDLSLREVADPLLFRISLHFAFSLVFFLRFANFHHAPSRCICTFQLYSTKDKVKFRLFC